MGMGKLTEIVQTFKHFGKGETPVGIIQNGTTANERLGFGKISTIEEIVAEKKLASPAIIVIGEVVRERLQLQSVFENINSLPKDSAAKFISA
jgi:uroporphyrin-III C-methyltransferase